MTPDYRKIYEMEKELGYTDLSLVDIQCLLKCRHADNYWGPETETRLQQNPWVLHMEKPKNCRCRGHTHERLVLKEFGSYPPRG